MNTYNIQGFFISFGFHLIVTFMLFYNPAKDKEETMVPPVILTLSSFELPQREQLKQPQPIKEPVKNIEKIKTTVKQEQTIAKSIESEHIVAQPKQDIVIQDIATPEVLMAKEDINKPMIEEVVSAVQPQKSQEEEMQEFTKANFKGIRDLILLNLAYPHHAKRMGIEGIVELMLVIDTNGKLIDVTIYKSSGHTILDKNALKAADALCNISLPKPQNIARITLPIQFKLN